MGKKSFLLALELNLYVATNIGSAKACGFIIIITIILKIKLSEH